jgi:hypothetical protein
MTSSRRRSPPARRILIGEFDEPADEAASRRDGARRETPGQHLSTPPVDHGLQDRFIGPQQRYVVTLEDRGMNPGSSSVMRTPERDVMQ